MTHDLDSLLTRLGNAPADHALDALAGDVGARLVERTAANRQTWRLRGAAALLVTSAGIFLSASTAAIATPEPPSAFAVWSSLAPSTLLDHGR